NVWPRNKTVLSRATTEVRVPHPAPADALVPASAGPAEATEAAPVGADAAAAPGPPAAALPAAPPGPVEAELAAPPFPPAAALPAAPPGPAVPASRSRSTRRRARTAATRMGRKQASPTSPHT